VWSSSPELGFPPEQFVDARQRTWADPRVASFASLWVAPVRAGDQEISMSTFVDPAGRRVAPPVLDGRLPETSSELAIGRRTAERLDADVGDLVELSRGHQNLSFTVVGIIVPPAPLSATTLGEGVHVTNEAFDDRFSAGDEAVVLLAITYADGVDAAAERDLAADPGWVFGGRSHARWPSPIANLMHVRGLVWWLIGLLAALALAIVAMVVTRRGDRRSRELEVLHALGFTGRDRRVAAAADAATLGAAALGVGVPLGLLVGSVAWRLAVGDLGIVDDLPRPTSLLLASATALVCAVGVAFLVGGRRRPRWRLRDA
jgi:hypothetical protein